MTGRSAPRTDILPVAQQKLWPQLRPATSLGLVLWGGTAIALMLGHRQSVEFDFSCADALDHAQLREAFPLLSQSTVLQDRPHKLLTRTFTQRPLQRPSAHEQLHPATTVTPPVSTLASPPISCPASAGSRVRALRWR